MAELIVTAFTHHFAVSRITPRAREAVIGFARRNVQWGTVKEGRRWVKAPVKVFSAATKDRSIFRFHINQLEEFKASLKNFYINEEMVVYETQVLEDYKRVELPIKDGWIDRPHQPPVIDYIAREGENRSRYVDMQTGKGKSYCTMKAAAQLQTIATYLFRPAYLEKWVIDIRKTYEIPFDALITVQGSGQLMELTQMVTDGRFEDVKVVLVSNKTFQNYLKLYEEHKEGILEMGYACTPPEFFTFLKSGLRVIDEVHQDFHLNFKIDLYTHVFRSVSLSATLLSDDDFIVNMHNVAYPPNLRYHGEAYDKYIAARAVWYSLADVNKVKWVDWASGRYSHNTYEHSIMKVPRMLDNYVALIIKLVEINWLEGYKDGDKCVIFAASIDFCTLLTERLREHFKQFRVERYVGSLDDPYENLMEPPLRVTTHGSAGVAVDVPQLTCTIMSIAMKSSPGSIQNLGRLRVLDDGRTPVYVYMNCNDIPKHREYHEHKVKLLEHRTTSFRSDQMAGPV